MELLQDLQAYITAQKAVANEFILLGIGLILIAGICQFIDESQLSNGLKIGALICGILILAGGFGYRYTETTLLKKQTELFHKDQTEFRQVETERMAKVKKDYPNYQLVFGGFIILSLLVIWFIKNPFWHGIAFSVIILHVVVMIIEAYSQRSINLYYQNLVN